jgi:hypothetical protein
MKITLQLAEKILQLSQGIIIPSSMAKHALIEELVNERIVERIGRIQKKLHITDIKALSLYLQTKYGINDLKRYIEVCQQENTQRNELVSISSDSKLKQVRTFKGFLINSYNSIQGKLNDKSITLNFIDGTFQFIYDFENFIPDSSLTIIGIENPENFRLIEMQQYLFEDIQPLFVSRYPQNQSKDLIKWLQSIPNNYLHFGDFDFAGIGIYLNEFKKHLGEKAKFFVPNNLENLIKAYGNKSLYDNQKMNFKKETIQEVNLLKLIEYIHTYKKGLEQEILIKHQ